MIDFTSIAADMEKRPFAPQMPKYLQLFDAIYGCVERGDFRPGEQLPPEAEIAQIVPASLGTVQKALHLLATRGVIVRQHGRGTFVADRSNALSDLWHLRFLGDDGEVLPIYTQVVDLDTFEEEAAGAFLQARGELVRVTRRISVNSEFTALSWFMLDAGKFHDLLALPHEELNGVHLRDVMRDRFNVVTLRAAEQVSARILQGDICKAIGIAPGSTGLVSDIRGFGGRDAPVSYQRLFVPPNTRPLEIREHHPGA